MTTTSSKSTPLSLRGLQAHGILMSWSLIVVGLILLMSLPDFDPGGFRGSWFGTVLVGLWGSALLVWALGMVRRNAARMGLRSLIAIAAALALTFGACPWVPIPYSVLIALAASSVWMLVEAWRYLGRPNADAQAYRGPLYRLLLCGGGMMMLAYSSRVLALLAARLLKLI